MIYSNNGARKKARIYLSARSFGPGTEKGNEIEAFQEIYIGGRRNIFSGRIRYRGLGLRSNRTAFETSGEKSVCWKKGKPKKAHRVGSWVEPDRKDLDGGG